MQSCNKRIIRGLCLCGGGGVCGGRWETVGWFYGRRQKAPGILIITEAVINLQKRNGITYPVRSVLCKVSEQVLLIRELRSSELLHNEWWYSITGGFDGLEVACVLAYGTQVCGFKPDRSRWIFQGEKFLSTPSFGGEVKPSVPCRFTACKRSLNVRWKSGIFRQNSSAISRPCSSTFGCEDLLKTASGERWNIRK